jgi:hypothetical protein
LRPAIAVGEFSPDIDPIMAFVRAKGDVPGEMELLRGLIL